MANTELEGGVRLNDLNMNQDVKGIVADYEKAVEANSPDDCQDIPREEMDVNGEAETMVARGRLDRATGMEIPLSSKARSVQVKQCCPSKDYLKGYEGVRWDNE